jgi:hypothetical protein
MLSEKLKYELCHLTIAAYLEMNIDGDNKPLTYAVLSL